MNDNTRSILSFEMVAAVEAACLRRSLAGEKRPWMLFRKFDSGNIVVEANEDLVDQEDFLVARISREKRDEFALYMANPYYSPDQMLTWNSDRYVDKLNNGELSASRRRGFRVAWNHIVQHVPYLRFWLWLRSDSTQSLLRCEVNGWMSQEDAKKLAAFVTLTEEISHE